MAKGLIRQKPHSAGVGNERKADMRGALLGNPTDKNPLTVAKHELHSQHPIAHDDLGPHHEDSTHIRHLPLHGMKPTAGY